MRNSQSYECSTVQNPILGHAPRRSAAQAWAVRIWPKTRKPHTKNQALKKHTKQVGNKQMSLQSRTGPQGPMPQQDEEIQAQNSYGCLFVFHGFATQGMMSSLPAHGSWLSPVVDVQGNKGTAKVNIRQDSQKHRLTNIKVPTVIQACAGPACPRFTPK